MPGIEQRRFVRSRPRGLVATRGAIIIDQRTPAVDCIVLDLSAGGACIDVTGQTPIPERVTFVHSGNKKQCRVVWRRGRRLGLQY
jgi:hypothetical protein